MLTSKTILITGGTSRLGREIVKKAVEAGAGALFTYYEQTKEAEKLSSLGATGFQVDLSKTRAIDEFAAKIKERFPSLDVLIHNAAAVRDHTLQNLTEEEWDYVLNVDLKAPYYLTKKLLPLLFKDSGLPRRSHLNVTYGEAQENFKKIFFLTSRTAVTGGVGISNYAAAKAGLIGLTRSLARELGKRNILVNAVNPGFMESGMTRDVPAGVKERQAALSPLGKISDPAEVADFLLYLASERMTQVTGQIFHFESRGTSA